MDMPRKDMPRKAHLPTILILLLIAVIAPLGLWILQQERPPPIGLDVMSFNIRNGNGKDGDNRWELRKDLVVEVIDRYSPDVAGLQEVFDFQLDHLLRELPQYRAVGEGRDGGRKGEHCPILYHASRFNLIECGTFWLSDTPDVPSTHWGNSYRRICTWAQLEDRHTLRPFIVYNTHFDHRSETSRRNSAQQIMDVIAKQTNKIPFAFMGDFNSLEGSPVANYLVGRKTLLASTKPNPVPLIDTWRAMHPLDIDSGTVSLFRGCRIPCKIDNIYLAKKQKVIDAEVIRFHRNGRYPSDHYPVRARVALK